MQCFLSQIMQIAFWFNRTHELTREYQYGGAVTSLFMMSWAIQSFCIDQWSILILNINAMYIKYKYNIK